MARLLMERDDHPGGQVSSRLWVEIDVTRTDLADGINAVRPGRHRFAGFWYGRDATTHASFGKIRPVERAVPIGRVGRHVPAYMARKLGAGPRIALRAKPRIPVIRDRNSVVS